MFIRWPLHRPGDWYEVPLHWKKTLREREAGPIASEPGLGQFEVSCAWPELRG